jgi:predicted AAA+ superfamily ATPase
LKHFEIVNRGSLLENIVYIELLRRGNDSVNSLKVNRDKQIDFVAIKGSLKTYYQVAEHIFTKELEEREIGNLRSIKDSYEKILLVLEEGNYVTEDGIKIINLID